MTKRAYVPVALTVVGVVLLFFLQEESPLPEPPTNPEIAAARPTQTDAPNPGPPVALSTEPVEDKTLAFRGFVQSLETGEGVEGATVTINREGKGEPFTSTEFTDGEGGFAVTPRLVGKYIVRVEHATLFSEEHGYRVVIHEGERASDLVIWMIPGVTIAGRVYDAVTNEGIPGVKVGLNRSQSPGATTDAEGRYRIDDVRTGNRRVFLSHAKGYLDPPSTSNGLNVTVSNDRPLTGVDFALERGVFAAIEGIVVNQAGDPVACAEVNAWQYDTVTQSSQSQSGVSHTDGTFRLEELRLADGFIIDAKTQGYKSELIEQLALTVDGIRDVILTLHPTGSISGRVVDESTGKPVPEPKFVVSARHYSSGIEFRGGGRVNLDEEGRFELIDLPQGRYALAIDSNPDVFLGGFRRPPEPTIELAPGQRLEGIELPFDYARHLRAKATPSRPRSERPERPKVGEVHGRVVNARTEEPVTSFELTGSHKSRGSGRTSSQNVHDPDGRFVINERDGDLLNISVAAAGFAPARNTVNGGLGDQPTHEVTIRLEPGALIEGMVVDATREPVAGAEIYIGIDPSQHERTPLGLRADAVSGPDGTFRLDTLAAGTKRIYASHPSFAVGSAEVTATTTRVSRAEIVLRSGGAITGFVTYGGTAVPGKALMILNDTGTNVRVANNQTDREGRYRLENLLPGAYTVYMHINNSDRSLHVEAAVAEGRETRVDLNFAETNNAIEGAVLHIGDPVSIIFVSAEIRYGASVERTKGLAEAGTYKIENLPIGVVSVTIGAELPDGETEQRTFAVPVTAGAVRHDIELSAVE